MKKILCWALCLSLLAALCACGEPAEPKATVVNPVEESSAEAILEELGIPFTEVPGAEETAYAVIREGERSLAQMCFTLDGVACTCRITAAEIPEDGLEDISGMCYDWTSEDTAPLGYNEAALHWIEGAQGVIQWYDYAPGLLYSVSVDSGATRESLLALAQRLYTPAQGETDGMSADAELMNVLAAISKNYHDGTAGCSLVSAKYAGMLLDWFVASGEDTALTEVTTIDFLSTLSGSALEEFSAQMQSVYAAAQELCGEQGAALLESCGYEAVSAPWSAAQAKTCFTAILEIVGE